MRMRKTNSKVGSLEYQRKGIRIRCRNAHPEVCSAIKRFTKWLRNNYEFPTRVPVYLFNYEQLRSRSGHLVSASFFAPDDLSVEPYIRIATGDYIKLKKEFGKHTALAYIMCSLAHEVIHYLQWYKRCKLNEKGVVKKAQAI